MGVLNLSSYASFLQAKSRTLLATSCFVASVFWASSVCHVPECGSGGFAQSIAAVWHPSACNGPCQLLLKLLVLEASMVPIWWQVPTGGEEAGG